MTLEAIKQRLSEHVSSAVEAIAEELQNAVDEAAEETDEEHEDEILDIASERDHLAAELEIAKDRVVELEAEVKRLTRELAKTPVAPRQRSLL